MILSDVIATLVGLIRNGQDLKAINLSLGYNWVPNYQRGPNNDAEIQNLVKSHGVIMRAIADLAADRDVPRLRRGNDSNQAFPNVGAQWSSPFNWAAVNAGISPAPAWNILVVELTGRDHNRSAFSNVGGDVAAPARIS